LIPLPPPTHHSIATPPTCRSARSGPCSFARGATRGLCRRPHKFQLPDAALSPTRSPLSTRTSGCAPVRSTSSWRKIVSTKKKIRAQTRIFDEVFYCCRSDQSQSRRHTGSRRPLLGLLELLGRPRVRLAWPRPCISSDEHVGTNLGGRIKAWMVLRVMPRAQQQHRAFT
jgi:hypothetical protein